MPSPTRIDEQKPEDKHALSPVFPQQVWTVGEKKRPWLKPLMRGVGAVLPLVGGFASLWVTFLYLPLDYGDVPLDYGALGPLVALPVGVVSALLIRSWWAILVVPLAFILGALLAVYGIKSIPLLTSVVYAPNPLAVNDVGFGVFLNVIIGSLLAVISTLTCTVFYKSREKERQK